MIPLKNWLGALAIISCSIWSAKNLDEQFIKARDNAKKAGIETLAAWRKYQNSKKEDDLKSYKDLENQFLTELKNIEEKIRTFPSEIDWGGIMGYFVEIPKTPEEYIEYLVDRHLGYLQAKIYGVAEYDELKNLKKEFQEYWDLLFSEEKGVIPPPPPGAKTAPELLDTVTLIAHARMFNLAVGEYATKNPSSENYAKLLETTKTLLEYGGALAFSTKGQESSDFFGTKMAANKPEIGGKFIKGKIVGTTPTKSDLASRIRYTVFTIGKELALDATKKNEKELSEITKNAVIKAQNAMRSEIIQETAPTFINITEIENEAEDLEQLIQAYKKNQNDIETQKKMVTSKKKLMEKIDLFIENLITDMDSKSKIYKVLLDKRIMELKEKSKNTSPALKIMYERLTNSPLKTIEEIKSEIEKILEDEAKGEKIDADINPDANDNSIDKFATALHMCIVT